MSIKATFAAPTDISDDFLRGYRLENKSRGFYKQLSVISGKKQVVDVRFYLRGETVLCCLWVNFPHSGYSGEYPTQHPVGRGKSDSEISAFSRACHSAGYSFDAHLSAGDMNIGNIGHEALLSIAESLGFTESWILSANA